MGKLRFATVGTSMISDNFIEALAGCDEATYRGTYSRDADRAARWTSEHGGDMPFASMDAVCASDQVDAVYIANPNALHLETALACIRAGKHVLVEKPLCSNAREAQLLFDAAREHGVVAMEAMRPLHDPAFLAVEDALPRIGRIRRASLRFGKYSSRYDEVLAGRRTNIFDARMASGALMDIGVYTVEPMVWLFGEPEGVFAAAALVDPEHRATCNGAIDIAGTALAAYDGMVVELSYSKVTVDLLPSQIEGEQGTITIDRISSPRSVEVRLRGEARRDSAKAVPQGDAVVEKLDIPACDNTMGYEIRDFAAAVAGELDPLPYERATLASLRIMDEVRAQTGVAFPADAR